ncbi:hypothetical protein BRAS3809_3090006 [Bradyrhizobium sp. STM 3809]|nr:hypothetical protein BRAS3809_3090006 [Bradyrhizobium sp. STM 3809]
MSADVADGIGYTATPARLFARRCRNGAFVAADLRAANVKFDQDGAAHALQHSEAEHSHCSIARILTRA